MTEDIERVISQEIGEALQQHVLSEHIATLEAEVARLQEALEIRNEPEQIDPNTSEYHKAFYAMGDMQLCGHPIQAIRSTPYIGDQHSNYCGWCADVEHEHELCQTLTAELLEYRGQVARLREALALCRDVIGEAHSYHAKTNVNFGLYLRLSGCDMALDEFDLGTVLAQHDAEVRAQERERCQAKVEGLNRAIDLFAGCRCVHDAGCPFQDGDHVAAATREGE